MTLPAGSRLGPYEVLSSVGAGGMGEVYKAKDTRLGRTVAIKILPEAFASDRERLSRFEQEARAVSTLNHPNIVVVYDVGRTGEVSYIAMELVEGRTLRELLIPDVLPLRRILPLAAQIAEGLAKAHAAGIVHRDLKPDNVVVNPDGLVKILDFGLAKLVPSAAENLTTAPTAAHEAPRTEAGVVLGTIGYMSPEQAASREVDYRSDQFSFGSILYEMATGRRAFTGDSPAQALAAIIERDPPPVALVNPDAPAPLVWIIERCLAKAPADRFESTRDLARDLANLRDRLSGVSAVGGVSPAPPPRRVAFRGALPWILSGILLVALAWSLLLRQSPEGPGIDRIIQFSVSSPEGANFHSGEILTKTAMSPDGRSLALVAFVQGRSRLFLRSLDSATSRALPGTEGAQSPFWSPDGRSLAFAADGKLKKLDLGGGPAQTLCDVSFEGTGSWSRDGTILFAEAAPGREGIHRVSASGGERERVTTPDASRKEQFHFWPHFLPDGRHFLYVAIRATEGPKHEVRIGSLDSKSTESLGPIDSRVEYAPPGLLLFAQDGSLLARPFDAKSRRWAGPARSIVDRLYYFWGPANAGFSASQNGTLAYEQGTTACRVVWLDRGGREVATLASLDEVDHLRLSPDGRSAALDVADPRTGTSDIWVYDLSRAISARLTADPSNETTPTWSPDGARIVFRSDRNGPPDLFEVPSSGGGMRPVVERAGSQKPTGFSPDGRFLLFVEADRTTGDDLWLLPLSGERRPIPLLRTRFNESDGSFSPDGRWISYTSDETGTLEVYVSPRDGQGQRTRISTRGGFAPRWRRDGKELFYLAPARRMMAVPVKAGARFEAGDPIELFQLEAAIFNYDVGSDSARFLASVAARPAGPPITVVVNWPALLKATS